MCTQSGKALTGEGPIGSTILPASCTFRPQAEPLNARNWTRRDALRVSQSQKVLPSCPSPSNTAPMDRRTPYTLSVLAPSTDGADESRTTIQNRLRDFVLEFQLDNAFIYRYGIPRSLTREACSQKLTWCNSDQLRQNVLVKQFYCDVDIAHLISYNEELAHKLTTEPADIIPLVGATPIFCPSIPANQSSLNWHFKTALGELSTPVSGISLFHHTSFSCTPQPRTFPSVT